MRTSPAGAALFLLAAVILSLSPHARAAALAPAPAQPDSVTLRPAWTVGDRTHWQLEASQTTTPLTDTGDPGAPHREAQSLLMRITVLAVAADGAATLGVAFERIALRWADQSAEADGGLNPEAEAEPQIAEPNATEPNAAEDVAPLTHLARVYARCALRIETAPDGRVTSLTGLERVREFAVDHPDLATALGPISLAHMPRTLESLWCFDPDQSEDQSPVARKPADRWSVSEPVHLSLLGQATRTTHWTLNRLTDTDAHLEATREIALKTRTQPSPLSPSVDLADQRQSVLATYDLSHRTARQIDQSATMVVATRLGLAQQARTARTKLETTLSVTRRPN